MFLNPKVGSVPNQVVCQPKIVIPTKARIQAPCSNDLGT